MKRVHFNGAIIYGSTQYAEGFEGEISAEVFDCFSRLDIFGGNLENSIHRPLITVMGEDSTTVSQYDD